jgi:hypothetical protein
VKLFTIKGEGGIIMEPRERGPLAFLPGDRPCRDMEDAASARSRIA